MAVEPSILEKYDTLLIEWLVADFALVYPGLDVQVLFATPDRQFAEYVTKKYVDSKMLKVPRIAVSRMDPSRDSQRHNRNRMVGRWRSTTDQTKWQSPWFPAPATIPYQVTFWTDKMHQANRWLERILFQFRSGYRIPPFEVYVDATWGSKYVTCFLDGVRNSSDIEPQDGPRLIRYDADLKIEGWIFDQAPVTTTDTAGTPEGGVPEAAFIQVTTETPDSVEVDMLPKDHDP